MKKIILSLFVVSSLAFSLPAFSQGPDSRPGKGEKKEKLHALMQERLMQNLSLTAEQSQKLSAISQKYQEKKKELRGQIKDYRKQLEVASNSSDAGQVSKAVTNFIKARQEMDQLEDSQFKEVKSVLSPQQQAKYLLFKEQMRHEMMKIKKGKNS